MNFLKRIADWLAGVTYRRVRRRPCHPVAILLRRGARLSDGLLDLNISQTGDGLMIGCGPDTCIAMLRLWDGTWLVDYYAYTRRAP